MRLRPTAGTRWGGRVISARRRRLGRVLITLLLVMYGWLFWPFLTLWQLDRALVRDDQASLARLVDLAAVRDAIRRSLNKDAGGTLGPFSDDFIEWLQKAIRRRGTSALDQEVTLAWVREQLLSRSPPGTGLWPALSWAFFDHPLHFTLRLGGAATAPVVVRMRFTGGGWRISALYF